MHLHFVSLFLLTHKHLYIKNTHHLRVTWMPHFTVCTVQQCWHRALTCGVSRVLRAQFSVAPTGFHTHLPFCNFGHHWVQAKCQDGYHLPQKVDTPQGWAAILPPWCQALPHLCGHRAAAHSLYRYTPLELAHVWINTHAYIHRNIYIYIIFFVCEHV